MSWRPMSRSLVPFRTHAVCVLALLSVTAANAQSASNDAPPVAYASASELNNILNQVKQTAQSIDADLAKTRIDKWKTDSAIKRDAQNNVDSVRRNLQSALPDMITALTNSPEDLPATFKLYRNMDALFDIFGQVVESAGAFGTKDEYQILSNELGSLQSARRMLGERMQSLAISKETELTRLRNVIKAAQ